MPIGGGGLFVVLTLVREYIVSVFLYVSCPQVSMEGPNETLQSFAASVMKKTPGKTLALAVVELEKYFRLECCCLPTVNSHGNRLFSIPQSLSHRKSLANWCSKHRFASPEQSSIRRHAVPPGPFSVVLSVVAWHIYFTTGNADF